MRRLPYPTCSLSAVRVLSFWTHSVSATTWHSSRAFVGNKRGRRIDPSRRFLLEGTGCAWCLPGWRNWQTRRTQNPVPAREWEFDPPSGHHLAVQPLDRSLVLSYYAAVIGIGGYLC